MDRLSPRPEGHPPPYPPREQGQDDAVIETHTRRFNVARYYPEDVPFARYAAKQHIRLSLFAALVDAGVHPDRAEAAVEERVRWIPAPGIRLPGQGYLNGALDVTFLGPDPNQQAHVSPSVGLHNDTQVTDTEGVASPELAATPTAVG
jgi:hypothetical protein